MSEPATVSIIFFNKRLAFELNLFVCGLQFATEQELTKLGKVASDNPFLTTTAMAPSYDKMPKGQRFFVTTFVKPLLDTLADVIPTFYDEGKANLQRNLERWDAFTNNTIV